MILDGRVRGFRRGERVWRRPPKVNLGRKWLQMEDEAKPSVAKNAGGLGRSFGGSGLSKCYLRHSNFSKTQDIHILGPP